jgi:hypothetical protein
MVQNVEQRPDVVQSELDAGVLEAVKPADGIIECYRLWGLPTGPYDSAGSAWQGRRVG